MTVFLDTSYLIALNLTDDELHARALRWSRALDEAIVTTEYVLIEFLDALSDPSNRAVALELVKSLADEPEVTVVPSGPELLEEALQLYGARPDKYWGITDCCSFVVMQRAGLTAALTHDHHFEQAGFQALLRRDPPAD